MPWVLVPDRDRPAHPVLSIRPQSPCPFLSVLEESPVSRLYRFTEIMSFLDVRANSCHLKGPKYIPKPDRKLFLGCTLFRIIHCFELSESCVLVSLRAYLGLGFPHYRRCLGRLSMPTSPFTPPGDIMPGVGAVDAELVEGGQGGGGRGWYRRRGAQMPSACCSHPCLRFQGRAGWDVGTMREDCGP